MIVDVLARVPPALKLQLPGDANRFLILHVYITELVRYPWPGNVRELRRVIQQSAMLTPGKVINPEDLRFEAPMRPNPMSALPDPSEGFKVNEFVDEIKLHLIRRAMELGGDVQARAARLLGITPQAINQFLKSRNLQ